MFFLEEMKKLKEEYQNRIAIFIDMDGVVADYRFGEGKNMKKNMGMMFIKEV